MRLSNAFRAAAELVASGREPYSCDAILRASGGRAPGALLWYLEHFTPSEDSPEPYWLDHVGMTKQERREWRLTALLLAAAITKAGGI